MDRNEFVGTLRGVLNGEVPASVVEDNVQYYNNYISQEIAGGKSEQEVMDALGDPRLIARTIIDTQGQQSGYSESCRQTYYTEEEPEREKGLHAEPNDKGGVDIKYKSFNFNTWYGKLLLIVAAILILALIFTIFGGILSGFVRVLLPVLLILLIIRIFTGNR